MTTKRIADESFEEELEKFLKYGKDPTVLFN